METVKVPGARLAVRISALVDTEDVERALERAALLRKAGLCYSDRRRTGGYLSRRDGGAEGGGIAVPGRGVG